MDVKALLNEDKDDQDRNATPQTKRPPPLSTTRSASLQASTPLYTHESPQRYHAPIAYSPGSLPPPSAHSHTSTPHSSLPPPNFQSPYQRNAPLPSPGPRSGSLSNSYFPLGQRPSSHHSFHRSSTSPLEPAPPHSYGSPIISRTIPPSAHSGYSHQPFQPNTPLGPPPILRHDSTHSTFNYSESPGASYARHRSSSGASHASLGPANNQHLPPPRSSGYPPDLTRRESHQSLGSHYPREASISVSPKTVAPSLPRQTSYPDSSLRYSAQPDVNMMQEPPAEVQSAKQYEQAVPHKPLENISEDQILPSPEEIRPKQMHLNEDLSQASLPRIAQPPAYGIKREADSAASAPEPLAKKPRMSHEIPIWAKPKRGLRPVNRGARLQPGDGNNLLNRNNRSRKPSPNPAMLQHNAAQPKASGGPTVGNALEDCDYDRSFRDIVPLEDLTQRVSDFIHGTVVQGDPDGIIPFEIEAKVGRLVYPGSDDRIVIPTLTECVIDSRQDMSFKSNMSQEYHKFMNDQLNEAVRQSIQPPEAGKRARHQIVYQHRREVDTFYDLPPTELSKIQPEVLRYLQTNGTRFKPKVRITRDAQTGETLAKVIKSRVKDLNVFCPASDFDWRVSINVELTWDGPIDVLEEHSSHDLNARRSPDRNKDRLSYTHQFCQIDLTQVKVMQGPDIKEMSHELEVEFNVDTARREGIAAFQGRKNRYVDYVKVFLDNVRLLARQRVPQ